MTVASAAMNEVHISLGYQEWLVADINQHSSIYISANGSTAKCVQIVVYNIKAK